MYRTSFSTQSTPLAVVRHSRSRRDVTHHVHFLDDNIRDSAKGITQEPPSRVVLRESVVFRDIKRTCVVRLMQLISRYSKNVVQLYGWTAGCRIGTIRVKITYFGSRQMSISAPGWFVAEQPEWVAKIRIRRCLQLPDKESWWVLITWMESK